jgi:hypothetical protein
MMTQTGTLGRTPVILVVLLTIVTCGAYVPIWHIRTRTTLEGLNTSTKPPRYLPYGLLSLYVVAVLDVFLLAAAASYDPMVYPSDAGRFYYAVATLYFCMHAVLAARTVDILEEYSYEGLTLRRNVAWLRAIIFSAPYLQYDMNRLPAPLAGIYPSPEST